MQSHEGPLSEQEARKAAFLKEKNLFEASVPLAHRQYWGSLVFIKKRREVYRPILLLGPYSVPPSLRPVWMDMYENAKQHPVKRIWYWGFSYGAPFRNAYSPIRIDEVIHYSDAVRHGIAELDAELFKKLMLTNSRLNKAEIEIIAAFKMLPSELAKRPEDRIPEKILEDYETTSRPKKTRSRKEMENCAITLSSNDVPYSSMQNFKQTRIAKKRKINCDHQKSFQNI